VGIPQGQRRISCNYKREEIIGGIILASKAGYLKWLPTKTLVQEIII
jgi:hypothetical protein